MRLDARGSGTDRPCPRTARREPFPVGARAGHDIACVERELRLEERRARQAADADERVVRRDDDVFAGDRAAVGRDAQRGVGERTRLRCARRFGRPSPESLARGRRGTCGDGSAPDCRTEYRARRRAARRRRTSRRTPARAASVASASKASPSVGWSRAPDGRVQIAVDPREIAVDLVLAARSRRSARSPRAPRPRPPARGYGRSVFTRLGQPRVRDHREVRRGVAGVAHRAPRAFEHHDRLTREDEEVRRSEAGDSPSDNHDIGGDVSFQSWENGEGGGVGPGTGDVAETGCARVAMPNV